jgi:uncharacterized alkaline shock family protein YloU
MADTNEIKTKLTFDEDVIRKIAGITAQRVEGLISLNGNAFNELANTVTGGDDDPKKGITADVGEKQVSLKMNATIEYGTNANQIFREVTRRVKQALTEMTGLELVQLELNIDDIKTKKELQTKKNDE